MPRYVVTLEEVVTYDVIVEAENEEEAEKAAEETFVQAEDIGEFHTTVVGREATNVELMKPELVEAGA